MTDTSGSTNTSVAMSDAILIHTLQRALQEIKGAVCGEKNPNWMDDHHVITSRNWIADICDTMLALKRRAPEPAGRLIEDDDGAPVSQAAHDVIAERSRQITAEGWTPEHDDEHEDMSLAQAAACYASSTKMGSELRRDEFAPLESEVPVPVFWPISWSVNWWKPKDYRRDLVRAAAMLIAEIERIDRLQPPTKEPKHGD